MRRDHDPALVWIVLVASGAILLWMGRALITGEVPFTGDLLHLHYPLRDFYARALASGQHFQWMPSLFAGFDLAGEGQLGGYHPLHWVLYRALPLDTAFDIELVAAYPFLFAGMWLFLRRWCDPPAAAFGAMLFTFCGFNLTHGVHPNMVGIIAHVPWMLWAIHLAVDSSSGRRRCRFIAVIALLTGSELLLGHPQALWISGLIEAVYAAMVVALPPGPASGLTRPGAPTGASRRSSAIAGAGAVVLGKLLGVAVGAVQFLATLHAVQHSTRAPYDPVYASTFSLPPRHLWQLLHPYLLWGRIIRWNEVPGAGDEASAYGGAVALILAVWWLVLPRRREADGRMTRIDRFGICVAGFALVGIWLSLGRLGGLYLFQGWVPFVRQFRAPVRYVVLTQIGLATLAALALMRLMDRDAAEPTASPATRRATSAPWAIAGASALSAVWMTATMGAPVSRSAQGLAAAAAGPVIFTAAAALLTFSWRGRRWALVGLVLLAAGDQALYGVGGVVAWHDFLTRRAVIDLMGRADLRPPIGPARMAYGGFPNLFTLAGYRVLDGYLGLTPAKKLNYTSARALRVAQVEYTNDRFPVTHPEPLERFAREWFKLPAPLPRIRLVTESRVSRQPAIDLEAIDVQAAALTTRDLDLAGGTPGDVTVTADEPGVIRVRTRTAGRQLLIVSESFDDGWIASVDDAATGVEEVNGDFLGCVVPAGEHDVRLEFSPARQTLGLSISLGGLLIAAVLAGASIRPSYLR